jgi:hypothetical protein
VKLFQEQERRFCDVLQRCNPSKRPYEFFRDWLEISALMSHQIPYHAREIPIDADFERLEADFMQKNKSIQKGDLEIYKELYAITVVAMESGFGDFLGSIYMSQGFGSSRAGQFFTPYAVSSCIAQMNGAGDEYKRIIEEKGLITVQDPACGAGGMLIAVAEEVAKQGYHPGSCVRFYGVDIDRDCFNMTYIQLSLLGLQGIITHGNALSLEEYEVRPTMGARLFDEWLAKQRQLSKIGKQLRKLFEADSAEPVESAGEPVNAQDNRPVETKPAKRQITNSEPDFLMKPKQLSLFG